MGVRPFNDLEAPPGLPPIPQLQERSTFDDGFGPAVRPQKPRRVVAPTPASLSSSAATPPATLSIPTSAWGKGQRRNVITHVAPAWSLFNITKDPAPDQRKRTKTRRPAWMSKQHLWVALQSPHAAVLCVCLCTFLYGVASSFAPPPFGVNSGPNATECAGPDFEPMGGICICP